MPRSPQQARAKATVSAIIEAAAILMAESGPKALTTRRIAERAGAGVGSVYEYVHNREAVIAYICINGGIFVVARHLSDPPGTL